MTIYNKTILVVEDHPEMRSAFQLLFEGEGYFVVTAENGKRGLEILRNMEAPCAVITDLKMPEMDGFGFLQEKNADPAIASILVIVVSATPDMDRLVGVAAVIMKPFDISRLLDEVKKHRLG
ncbi:response regulator [Bdellovibrionota bacterium FG-2]